MSKIQFKDKEVNIDIDGITVKAIIRYWAKDYVIDIISPYQKRLPGRHMPFVAPAKFVINKWESCPANVKPVFILETCKEMIREDYFNESKDL